MAANQTETDLTIKRIRGFFALLTVFLVIIGQTFLYTSTNLKDIGIPASFWLCFAGVALFVASMAFKPPQFLQAYCAKLRLTRSNMMAAVAAALSLLAAGSMVLFEKKGNISYLPVISLWLASGICYVVAFYNADFSNLHWKDWFKTHRNEVIAIGTVTLFAFILRFYQLGGIPKVINGDEGRLGLAAISSGEGALANPFALFENIGAFYLQGMNTVFDLFGTSSFSLRLLPAIGGMLAIPALFLFARQIAGKRVALISAGLLAFSHTHINFSRTAGSDYIHTTWLVPLILYFLLSGLEKRNSFRSALAGVLLAIYFSIFQTAQIVLPILVIYTLLALLFFRSHVKMVKSQILVFWGGFVTLVLPEAVYILRNRDNFLVRVSANGTFQSGWLANEMASTGHSAVLILADRVTHAFLSLIYYPASSYYGSPVPMLTLFSATLFLIGLGISLWRTRSQSYFILNSYFWGFTVAVGIFAIPPAADTYRMLIALPAAMVLAAVALDQIVHVVGLGWKEVRLGYTAVIVMVFVSLIATNIWTYYGEFAGRCLYGSDEPTRFASYLGSYTGTLRAEETVYLLSNDVYFYGSHASVDFLDNGHKIINIKDPVDTLKAGPDEAIIANPDRIDELKSWASSHPGGRLHNFYDCSTLIMMSYQFP
ncbi:MAG: glycosyltransferase family 39 protein [Anaerolineaceae bacterium]|nr:glycosyltransferase family 39 protein [Anaerolineaceae bacterium]